MSYVITSWNVNSIRAVIRKQEFTKFIQNINPDILCLSETKLSSKFNLDNPDYPFQYFNLSKSKKGYSGTAIISKIEPIKVDYDFGDFNTELDLNQEGRIVTAEFSNFFLINVYTPNSGSSRLEYRTSRWDPVFSKYLAYLQEKKPIIVTGDLNCVHKEIDIHNFKGNQKSAGCTIEERESFNEILETNNLVDTYRHLNPEKVGYTYWSYRTRARIKNRGWRIDYFLVSRSLIDKVKESIINSEQEGSDHCPVSISYLI